MNIDTNALVSISEASQNFSKVAKLVDKYGSAIILKNDTPRYLIVEFEQAVAYERMKNYDSTKNISAEEVQRELGITDEQLANFEEIEFD